MKSQLQRYKYSLVLQMPLCDPSIKKGVLMILQDAFLFFLVVLIHQKVSSAQAGVYFNAVRFHVEHLGS
jgi:hypothetical protein